MYGNDDLTSVSSLGTLSLDRLAEFAIEEELIDGFEFLPDQATVIQGDSRFILPHRQACTFLIGMLRGRSWYLDDGLNEPAPQHQSGREPAAGESSPPPGHSGDRRNLESTLDALLTFTLEIGIIDGFEKDSDGRAIRIDIPACSTTMSFVDAVGYLFDCVQHEVRSMTEAA